MSAPTALAQATPPIIWTAGAKLKWDDFKAKEKPKKAADADAVTVYTIKISQLTCNQTTGEFKLKVDAVFIPDSSWSDSSKQSDPLLAHEQGHFDLAEITAQKVRAKLGELKSLCKCKMSQEEIRAYNKAYDEKIKEANAIIKAADAEQDAYDKETEHGTNEQQQAAWNEKIQKALAGSAPSPAKPEPEKKCPPPTESGTPPPPPTGGGAHPADCKNCEELKKKIAQLKEDKTSTEFQITRDAATVADNEKNKVTGPAADAAKERLQDLRKSLTETEKELKQAEEDLKKCCPESQKGKTGGGEGGGSYYERQITPGTFNVVNESGPNCTHDKGTPQEVNYTPISDVLANYTPATPGGGGPQGSTPGTPPAGSAPTAEKPPGGGTPDSPPQQSTPDEELKQVTPDNPLLLQTTDNPPPPTTTTETPPPPPIEITITVEVFDKENVLVAGHTEQGADLDGQLVMLATVKPGLTRGGDDDSAADPAKCITKTGHCTIRIQRRYAAALGVPDNGTQFQLDLSAKKHSSALAEVTGKTIKSDLASALPPGVELATQTFKVGARTFMVFNFAAPYNNTDDLLALVSGLIKIALETNWCDDGKPAAEPSNPAAASGATGSALPAAVLKLRRAAVAPR